jgi:uncharacterized protein (TIGR04376 family)
MGLFDDFSKFLEARLEEFLRNNPHLELQAIEEQLREQERDTRKLILDLQQKEKSLQNDILAIARDIQTWHARIAKAQAANRPDLANAAQEREASLLRQGNQLWGQMEGTKKRLLQAQELLTQINQKHQELKAKAAQTNFSTSDRTSPSQDTTGWNRGVNSNYSRSADPLDAKFQQLEIDEELKRMKRNL